MPVETKKKHKNCRIKLRTSWIWGKSVNNATIILGLCVKKLFWLLYCGTDDANWNCRRSNLNAKCMWNAPDQLPVTPFWKYYSRMWLVTLRKITETSGFTRRNLPYLGRTFLMLICKDITRHTYPKNWVVKKIMMPDECGLVAVLCMALV